MPTLPPLVPKSLVVDRTTHAAIPLGSTPTGYTSTCGFCGGTVRVPRDPKTNALLTAQGAVCLLCGQRYTVPAVAANNARLTDYQRSLVAKSVTRAPRH